MTVIYFAPYGGGAITAESNAPGAFPVFFVGHLPQTGFRSAKQTLVVSFATQARAFILNDPNILCTPGGGRTTAGSNAPGAFLLFFLWSLAPDVPRPNKYALQTFHQHKHYVQSFRIDSLKSS